MKKTIKVSEEFSHVRLQIDLTIPKGIVGPNMLSVFQAFLLAGPADFCRSRLGLSLGGLVSARRLFVDGKEIKK